MESHNPWIGVLLAGLMLNAFALFASSVGYTAWSILVRNRMNALILGTRRKSREEIDLAARAVCRWLRPLFLIAANALWVFVAVKTLRGD